MTSYYLPSGSKIGVGYQVHELAQELAARGHDVEVFSACPPVDGARYLHRAVRLDGPLRTVRFAFALRRIDFAGYDVLHAHGDDYWLWRRRARAHVRTLHGSCFDEALHIRGARERLRMLILGLTELLAAVVADRTVLVSPATRRWTPWVRTVIPNGVAGRFRPGEHAPAERQAVLFVGTWRGRKRGRLLAEQFVDGVLPSHPDAELWMVSADVPEEVNPAVIALGRLSADQLVDRYRRASVFCLPSSYEGFGIPYAEAMSCGLPVVATPNPGSDYVTDGGRAGVLVPDDQLGSTIAGLLDDPVRLRRLREAGLRRATEFTLASVVDRYESLYRETMAARSG